MSLSAHNLATESTGNEPAINELQSSHDSADTLSGELIERVRRRRCDLRTLGGVARESAKIYRLLAAGELPLAQVEVRSRVLKRHSEILSTLQVEQIARQLEAIEQRPGQQIHDDKVAS